MAGVQPQLVHLDGGVKQVVVALRLEGGAKGQRGGARGLEQPFRSFHSNKKWWHSVRTPDSGGRDRERGRTK